MEQYLHMAKQVLERHILWRAVRQLKKKGELFQEHF